MRQSRPVSRRRTVLGAVVALGAGALASVVVTAPPANATNAVYESYAMPASGTVTVRGHGNGHGRGLSQWGAQGRALAGQSLQQILGFYYPGTSLVTLGSSTVRVKLSGAGTYTTVSGATAVSGYGSALNATTRYRLVPSGSGFQLQALSGSAWAAVAGAPALAATADFSSSAGYVRLYRADGTSTDYRGTVGGVRDGTAQLTINRVPLDAYTQGVVPRESPAYWQAAALQAQAVAARTYARFSVEAHGADPYDICDTDSCQVYGGLARYDANGKRLYGEEKSSNDAVAATANRVLQYGGKTAFTQYSASDGGWTVEGSQPYLVARADPYDNTPGNPWFAWTREVSVTGIASYFGLAKVTQVVITERDGHGDWGGRVTAAFIVGVDGAGASKRISTTGFSLQAAMGLPHNWFTLSSTPPRGHLDGISVASDGTVTARGWAMDPDDTSRSITVDLTIGTTVVSAVTNQSRPDVANAYGTATDKFGFAQPITVPVGSYQVCAHAMDLDGRQRTWIGCKTVTNSAPRGHLDGVVRQPDGTYVATGWAMDPDGTSRSTIVRVNAGSATGLVTADVPRGDVARAYGTTTDRYGFAQPLDLAPGTQRICAYGIDLTGFGYTGLGCKDVAVPSPTNRRPYGALDSARPGGDGTMIVRGWTLDPDTTRRSIKVRVDLDGAPVATADADRPRADVQRALGMPIDAYGYEVAIPVSDGAHEVCAYGLDSSTSAPARLRCTVIVVPPSATTNTEGPIGALDSAASDGLGTVLVKGWSMDRDFSSLSVLVRIDVDGVPVTTVAARDPRADVQSYFRTSYDRYGYHASISMADGAHDICAYGLDIVTGEASKLRCATVLSQPLTPRGARAPIGALDSATAMGSGTLVVRGWAMDPDYSSASTLVRVDVDGAPAAMVAARGQRADVQRVFGTPYAGYGYQVPITTTPGRHDVCVFGLDVFTADPARLKCATVDVS